MTEEWLLHPSLSFTLLLSNLEPDNLFVLLLGWNTWWKELKGERDSSLWLAVSWWRRKAGGGEAAAHTASEVRRKKAKSAGCSAASLCLHTSRSQWDNRAQWMDRPTQSTQPRQFSGGPSSISQGTPDSVPMTTLITALLKVSAISHIPFCFASLLVSLLQEDSWPLVLLLPARISLKCRRSSTNSTWIDLNLCLFYLGHLITLCSLDVHLPVQASAPHVSLSSRDAIVLDTKLYTTCTLQEAYFSGVHLLFYLFKM